MSTVTNKKLGVVGGGESTFSRGQRSLTFLIALKTNLAIKYSRWMILVSKYKESYEKETQNKI